MAYDRGWAACQLQPADHIPRTERGLENNLELLGRLTDTPLGGFASEADVERAFDALVLDWDLDLVFQPSLGWDLPGQLGVTLRTEDFVPSQASLSWFQPDQVLARGDPEEWRLRLDDQWGSMRRRFPSAVGIPHLRVGPLHGLAAVFGWDVLLSACHDAPEILGATVQTFAEWCRPLFESAARSSAPVLLVEDTLAWPTGPLFRTSWYREHLFPVLASLIAILRDADKRVIFHSEGNYEAFLPDLAMAGVHGFILNSSMDLSETMADFGGSYIVIGNADERTLFNGSEAEIRLTIQRCLRSGSGHNGYVFSFGHELATNTPVASLEFAQIQFESFTGRAAA